MSLLKMREIMCVPSRKNQFCRKQFRNMITPNKQIREQAQEALKGKWDFAVLAWFIYFIITGSFSAGGRSFPVAPVISLILGGPMLYGIAKISLMLARGETPTLSRLFDGFNEFSRTLLTYLLMSVFIFLWSLLLIVPGIIKAIAYSQTFYILLEDKTIAPMDALRKSERMMYGYKAKYFGLCWSFFGWMLLCILTLGIGFLWLAPYMQVSFAKFYEEVKKQPAQV